MRDSSEGGILYAPGCGRCRPREARQIVEEIGKELEPKHPLGWQNGQLLVTFEHGCPNNILPIFYKRGGTYRRKEWRPLFPR